MTRNRKTLAALALLALAVAPGSYKMASGKVLSPTRSHNGVYAQLNEGATKELLLVDRNRLRSKDGRMEVAVELDRHGEVQNVKMTLVRA